MAGGQRFYKQSTWDEGGTRKVEHTFYLGAFEELLAYDPFGERRKDDWLRQLNSTEISTLADDVRKSTSRGFTGHENLDRTGFVHMNGCIFDPQLGRFLSADPVISRPDLSQRWNRYSYVMNSPLSLVDPSGFTEDEPGGNLTLPGGTLVGIGSDDIALVQKWLRPEHNEEDLAYYFAMREQLRTGAGQSNSGQADRAVPLSSQIDANLQNSDGSQTDGLAEDQATSGVFADVVDFGGLFAGAALLNVISGDGTKWRGYKNWKWNSIDWGGNSFTGARSVSLQIAKGLKLAGNTLFFLGAANSIWEGGNAALDGDKGGVAGATGDLVFGTGATFGGPVGLVGGAGYFVTRIIVEIPVVRAAVVTPIVDSACALSGSC